MSKWDDLWEKPENADEVMQAALDYAPNGWPDATDAALVPFDAAERYRAKGWTNTLPLPAKKKTPPPSGFTGHGGRTVETDDLRRWRSDGWRDREGHYQPGNIALRAAPNQLGLDVDAYDSKRGAETLAALEQACGPLPRTWISTSRTDGSGIRWYRVPPGQGWPGVAGDGIEIIQHGHRYAVVAPSIHPGTGQPYRWTDPNGELTDEPPSPGALPELPEAWRCHLLGTDTNGATVSAKPGTLSADRTRRRAAREWLAGLPDGEPCAYVGRLAADLYAAARREDGNAYDGSRDHVLAALRAGETGHPGVPGVLARGREVYVTTVAADRGGEAVAGGEWDRFTEGAAVLVIADPHGRAGRGCDCVPMINSDPDAFWSERLVLAHVHAFARARMCSPWAVLGVILARVITAVPPQALLPPYVGGHASLNLFIGLVGPSGSGKGAAEVAAADAVNVGPIETASPGSGEGLAHLFAHRDKKVLVRDRDAVLLSAPEVDSLAALGTRQGATLMPTLRQAWSGEALGHAYADPAKRLTIERHSYRLCLVVGVQPGRAGPLLDDAEGGTPQRFLWLPTIDPDAPDMTPPAPEEWRVPRQMWQPASKGFTVLPVPPVAADTIRGARLARVRGDGEALDGHALLTRLKVAAALALLDGRRAITEDDWRLAGQVMIVSDATRAGVVRYLTSQAERSNEARGRAEGVRASVASETADDLAAKRVSAGVLRRLRESGEAARGEARRAVAARDRQHFEEAVERLMAAGQVIEVETEHGARLRSVEASQ